MEEKFLSLILDYKMSREEAKAWKIAIMFMSLSKQYLPNSIPIKIGKRDPRKTNLFRHCYKLIRECDKYLQDYEYKLYITAQLQILKNIEGGETFIAPNCLVGPKAWKRWLVWKAKFDKNVLVQESEAVGLKDVKKELEDTKKFLFSKFTQISKQTLIDCLESRALFRWCALGNISGYYLVLSPIVKVWTEMRKVDLLESFALDLNLYKKEITPEIESFFKKEFSFEF